MIVSLENLTFKNYLQEISKKTPAPGGGSATASVLSLGIALYKMCLEYSSLNFTPPELDDIHNKINTAFESAVLLIEKDKDAYLNLQNVLKGKNSREIRLAYRDAAKISLEMILISSQMLPIISDTFLKIKKSLRPDLKICFNFIKVSFNSALVLFEINLEHIDPKMLESEFKISEIAELKDKFIELEQELENGS